MTALVTALREFLDVDRRLYNGPGERFDLFTVLEASARFTSYPKTVAGLVQFFHRELPHTRIKVPDGKDLLLQHGQVWVPISQLDFLRMLFLPLYHCSWDAEALELRDAVMRVIPTPGTTQLIRSLLLPSSHPVAGVRLEDVPEDWRDLLLDYIKKGAVDLSQYTTLQALEHRVDQLEGLVETDDSPVLVSQLLIAEEPLPAEEREVLAKTLRLDPGDFRTKREAMDLYAEANR
jgi:hypothetical protein